MQLSGVLDTSGTSTDDDHVHQPVHFGIGLVLERGGLNALTPHQRVH